MNEGGVKVFKGRRVKGRRIRGAFGLGSFRQAKENVRTEAKRKRRIGLRNQKDLNKIDQEMEETTRT